MTKRNYKNISVNFNLDDAKDKALYDWLSEKRAKTAFIKDILEEVLLKEVANDLEDKGISKLIEERDKNDTGLRYTTEDLIARRQKNSGVKPDNVLTADEIDFDM